MSRLMLLICLSPFLLHPAPASDLAREQRIAEQIREAILVGEPLHLSTDGGSFLAIHSPANTTKRRGAVILLHGMGANPDWTEVIQPLRSELPEHGWETLSLQMPVAAADAPPREYLDLIPEAGPRIDAAVDFLKGRGIHNIALLGHSLGARMAVEYLAGQPPAEIRALVAVGLSSTRNRTRDAVLAALRRLHIPVLDIYGSRDLDAVRQSAQARAAAAGVTGNAGYRQVEIPGADHFFHGLDGALVARINTWLIKKMSGVEISQGKLNGRVVHTSAPRPATGR